MEPSREMNVILYVLGRMNLLEAAGMVRGGRSLNPAGIARYDQLKATGFRPTKTEVEYALGALQNTKTVDDDLVVLVMHYDESPPTEEKP